MDIGDVLAFLVSAGVAFYALPPEKALVCMALWLLVYGLFCKPHCEKKYPNE